MEIIGWLSSLFFMICGIPQAYKCYKEGCAKGLSFVFISTWLLGEVFGLIYISTIRPYPWPLFINYAVSLLSTLVILKFYAFPRNYKTIQSNKEISETGHRDSSHTILYKTTY